MILNLENKDVDLSGWTIIDGNSNVCIISKGNFLFLSFHTY